MGKGSHKCKITWLDRTLMEGPYLVLCMTEKEYLKALKHLHCDQRDAEGPWVAEGGASTWHLTSDDGDYVALVCMPLYPDYTEPVIASMMAHEAVHVWQGWKDYIGEVKPGTEQEAYAVQNLVTTLMTEYRRREAQ